MARVPTPAKSPDSGVPNPQVMYVGSADNRIVTPEDLKAAGVEDKPELIEFKRLIAASVRPSAAKALTTSELFAGEFEAI